MRRTLAIGVMIPKLSNRGLNVYFEENLMRDVTWREGRAAEMNTRGQRYIGHMGEEQEKTR